MIECRVSIGIGAWKVYKMVQLVACPHVGDNIAVGGTIVTCERVYIGEEYVAVDKTIRFTEEAQVDEYVAMGWTRTP